MSNGGKRLKELIQKRGFKLNAVAEAIGVRTFTMSRWKDTAPIDKLFGISKFTGIPFEEIADCFNPDRDRDEPGADEN